jgi:hypothetical protein
VPPDPGLPRSPGPPTRPARPSRRLRAAGPRRGPSPGRLDRQAGRPGGHPPVRRVAPPDHPDHPTHPAGARVAKAAAAPVERVAGIVSPATAPVERVAGVRRCGPVDDRGNLARRCATLPHRGSEHGAGSLEGARFLAPVVGLIGPILRPLGPALAPVGSALAPITGPVGGLAGPVVPGGLLPLPALVGSGTGSQAGPAAGIPAAPFTGFEGTGSATGVASASPTYPVRLAADGASSPAIRSIRSWPALTGAVSLPGFPRRPSSPRAGRTPCRPPRAPASPWPPLPPSCSSSAPWPGTRPGRPLGPHLALLPPARLSRLATRATWSTSSNPLARRAPSELVDEACHRRGRARRGPAGPQRRRRQRPGNLGRRHGPARPLDLRGGPGLRRRPGPVQAARLH